MSIRRSTWTARKVATALRRQPATSRGGVVPVVLLVLLNNVAVLGDCTAGGPCTCTGELFFRTYVCFFFFPPPSSFPTSNYGSTHTHSVYNLRCIQAADWHTISQRCVLKALPIGEQLFLTASPTKSGCACTQESYGTPPPGRLAAVPYYHPIFRLVLCPAPHLRVMVLWVTSRFLLSHRG